MYLEDKHSQYTSRLFKFIHNILALFTCISYFVDVITTFTDLFRTTSYFFCFGHVFVYQAKCGLSIQPRLMLLLTINHIHIYIYIYVLSEQLL